MIIYPVEKWFGPGFQALSVRRGKIHIFRRQFIILTEKEGSGRGIGPPALDAISTVYFLKISYLSFSVIFLGDSIL